MRLASVLLLAFSAGVFAADPIPPADTPIPAASLDAGKAVTVDLGKKCIITATTTAKKVTWRAPEGVEFVALDGKRIAVWALPGTYTLQAMIPSGDDVITSDVVLTVTGARPPPPPVDELTKQLQAAYDADTSPTKKDDLGKLQEVMAGCVAAAKSGGKVRVTKDLQDGVHSVTELVIPGRLKGVRVAIGGYLAPKLGTSSVPVTEAFWTLAGAEYGNVAAALGKVVK